MKAKPFFKWVGGKTQLLPELDKYIPNDIQHYYETFLGGGALFFHLAEAKRFRAATIGDLNETLIATYRTVRDQPVALMDALDKYREDPEWNTPEQYYRIRSEAPTSNIDMASRFMYLNRTCFNGLYRVNRAGKFNVPFGKYKNPILYNAETIMSCSQALHAVGVQHGSYSKVIEWAVPGDFVYFDPPYVPVSKTSSFTAYIGEFDDDAQADLAKHFTALVNKGVSCLLSNSDTPLVRELYAGYEIHTVQARRAVSSKASTRGPVNEVIVVGRPSQV